MFSFIFSRSNSQIEGIGRENKAISLAKYLKFKLA